MDKKVQVFILSYNRPNYLKETLNSVSSQSYKDMEIIVSDNSTTDEVEKMIQTLYPEITYRRRNPRLKPIVHFQTVFLEVSSDYFMLFHDDDIMLQRCVEMLAEELDGFRECVAVSCNALIMYGNVVSKNRMFQAKMPKIDIHNPTDLARKYLGFYGETAPYPGYMYRRSAVYGMIPYYHEGRKYGDVAYLMKIAGVGKIRWVNIPLMYYRIHQNNDTAAVRIPELFNLLSLICQKTDIKRNDVDVTIFKIKHWLAWRRSIIKMGSRDKYPWRFRCVTFSLLKYISMIAIRHPVVFIRMALWKTKRVVAKKFCNSSPQKSA